MNEQRISIVIWSDCEIAKEEISPEDFAVSHNEGQHQAHGVRIGMGAKYHTNLFPWLTKCGRSIDDSATYSHNHANCRACQNVADPIFTYEVARVWVAVWRRDGYVGYGPESFREYSMRVYPAENVVEHISGTKYNTLSSDLQALRTSIRTLTSQDCIENDIRRADAKLLSSKIFREGQESDYFPLEGIATYALRLSEASK